MPAPAIPTMPGTKDPDEIAEHLEGYIDTLVAWGEGLESRVAELEAALKPMTEGTHYITSEHIQEAYRLLGKRYPF